MLYVVREDGQHVPAPYCDYCKDRIEKARQGNYVWNPQTDSGAAEIHHVHKRCDRAWQASNHTVQWYAGGLEALTVYLSNALDVDPEYAERKAKLLATL